MTKIRIYLGEQIWIHAAIGAACFVVGAAVGLGFANYLDGEWLKIVGAAAGAFFPALIAVFLIHYKQRSDSRHYESFVLSVVQEMHDDAQVLNRICELFNENQHSALIPKATAQAEELLDTIGVWERDVSKSDKGTFELRRFVYQLQKFVKDAKKDIAQAQTIQDAEMMNLFQSAGSLLEDRAPRYHSHSMRWLTEEEIEVRMWAVDHE